MENNEKKKYIELGKRIQSAREKKGLTQEQLAKLVGYQTATAISFIEAGDRKLKASELEKIAQELDCDVRYLLMGKDTPVTVRMALRSQHNDLDEEEVKKIESFIEFIKSEQHGKRRSDGSK